MKRRQFVFSAATFALLGGCGVLPNLGQPATSTPRVARVGILDGSAANDAAADDEITGLKQGLTELGYVDGQNIVFELRDSDGKVDPLPALANELIQLPVDVIVSLSTQPTMAVWQATRVIPIVFVSAGDPVAEGFVASLAHPGGNLTGANGPPFTTFQKELQILAQLVPRLSRVAILLNSSIPTSTDRLHAVIPTANTIGAQLHTLDVRSAEDVEPALAAALAWQAQAMMSFGGPGAVTDALPRLVNFQVQNRMPVSFSAREQVQAGGLLAYGASFNGLGRTAARYVDKILTGARPADLPVEQPTVYELVVNQTTAQALGLAIPPEIAEQVTEWVQ